MRAFRSRLRQAIAALPTSAHAFSSSGVLPTLTATAGERGGRGDLVAVVNGRPMKHHRVTLLPTLTAQSYGSNVGGSAGRVGKVRMSLQRLLPTLTCNRATYGTRRGKRCETLPGMAGGPLNPTWLEWYQGFPAGWTALACWETPSSPRAAKSSGTSSGSSSRKRRRRDLPK